jgi:hypothetical protein
MHKWIVVIGLGLGACAAPVEPGGAGSSGKADEAASSAADEHQAAVGACLEGFETDVVKVGTDELALAEPLSELVDAGEANPAMAQLVQVLGANTQCLREAHAPAIAAVSGPWLEYQIENGAADNELVDSDDLLDAHRAIVTAGCGVAFDVSMDGSTSILSPAVERAERVLSYLTCIMWCQVSIGSLLQYYYYGRGIGTPEQQRQLVEHYAAIEGEDEAPPTDEIVAVNENARKQLCTMAVSGSLATVEEGATDALVADCTRVLMEQEGLVWEMLEVEQDLPSEVRDRILASLGAGEAPAGEPSP